MAKCQLHRQSVTKKKLLDIIPKRMWETAYWSERVDVDKVIANTGEDGSVSSTCLY